MVEPPSIKLLPRPCKIEGHRFFTVGVCLAIERGVALVELETGAVMRFELMHAYSLQFTDREAS